MPDGIAGPRLRVRLGWHPIDRRRDRQQAARIVPLPGELDPKRFPHGITTDELRNGYEAARAKAGLKDVRFHDLRHTYASWLIQGGALPTAVRDLLGHSSLAVTSRYSHLGRKDLWQAVQGLSLSRGTRGGRGARKK